MDFPPVMHFKYRPVNASGHEVGFFSSKGSLSEHELVLDKTVIPLASIYQVIHRYSRLVIVYQGDSGPVNYVIAPYRGMGLIAPYRGMGRKLKETIDRRCSLRWAEVRQRELESQGLGAAFRSSRCGKCRAIVDLTGFAETPQLYCPFCETLVATDELYESSRNIQYRLCDRCGFYSKPTRYTATYLVVNVMWWKEHYSCHVCMRREIWKMLLLNLLPPFIGIVFAFAQAMRAYGAGIMDSYLPELVGANAYAKKGKVMEAMPLYEAMLDRMQVHAGLRYNMALAYATAGQWQECLEQCYAALEDCSNYTPAANLIAQALVNLQRPDEADRFSKSWGAAAVDAPQATADDSQRIHRPQAERPSQTEDGIRNVTWARPE